MLQQAEWTNRIRFVHHKFPTLGLHVRQWNLKCIFGHQRLHTSNCTLERLAHQGCIYIKFRHIFEILSRYHAGICAFAQLPCLGGFELTNKVCIFAPSPFPSIACCKLVSLMQSYLEDDGRAVPKLTSLLFSKADWQGSSTSSCAPADKT